MKALSVSRPWTTLILQFDKSPENRSWPTSYRGPLWLHAARSWDADAIPWAEELGLIPVGAVSRRSADHPTGLVGQVTVTGLCSAWSVRREPQSECWCPLWAADNQYHWLLTQPRSLAEPIACRGALGLWEPAEDVVAQARWST